MKKSATLLCDLNTDCVQWHPDKKNTLIAGCYQLKDELRVGKLQYLRYDNDDELVADFGIETPGVFRLAWKENGSLGTVMTDGSYREYNSSLEETLKIPVESEALLTSFVEEGFCGSSSGSVHKLDLESGTVASSWKAHSFMGADSEVWSLAYKDHSLLSGGDDSMLKIWDSRSGTLSQKVSGHSAGVTAISCRDQDIVTGSYDETLRTWDWRKLNGPVNEKNLGGGIWDLAWNGPTLLAVACMYRGFRVLTKENADWSETFTHDIPSPALFYAVSWSSSNRLATATFYDNTITVWKFPE